MPAELLVRICTAFPGMVGSAMGQCPAAIDEIDDEPLQLAQKPGIQAVIKNIQPFQCVNPHFSCCLPPDFCDKFWMLMSLHFI